MPGKMLAVAASTVLLLGCNFDEGELVRAGARDSGIAPDGRSVVGDSVVNDSAALDAYDSAPIGTDLGAAAERPALDGISDAGDATFTTPETGPQVPPDATMPDALPRGPDSATDGLDGLPGLDTIDASSAVDTRDLALDSAPTIPDVGLATPDANPAPDTAPAVPCDRLGPWTSTTTALSIPLPTAEYCFKVCPNAFEPIDPLSYAWTCTGFSDADRSISVNGQKVSCAGPPPRTLSGSVLPATVDGAWTFALSAGGHSGDFIAWAGTLRACP